MAHAIAEARIGRDEGGVLYGIPRVVMGENRTFVGGEDYLRQRGVEVANLDSQECVALVYEFIAARRSGTRTSVSHPARPYRPVPASPTASSSAWTRASRRPAFQSPNGSGVNSSRRSYSSR